MVVEYFHCLVTVSIINESHETLVFDIFSVFRNLIFIFSVFRILIFIFLAIDCSFKKHFSDLKFNIFGFDIVLEVNGSCLCHNLIVQQNARLNDLVNQGITLVENQVIVCKGRA